MTEWAPAAVSLALRSAVQILAYPMTNMSMLPSETFGPNRDVMSSGGTADPTFHVTMYTLSKDRGNAALCTAVFTECGVKEDIICCNPWRNSAQQCFCI